MSTSIISCPKCKTLVLSDTLQCPSCNHILDETKSDVIQAISDTAAKKEGESTDTTCGECGVTVRPSVVRCWNCGSFMQEKVAQRFRRKQQSPRDYDYSDRPDSPSNAAISEENDQIEIPLESDSTTFMPKQISENSLSSIEGDFTLSDNAQLVEDDEDDFELDDFELSDGVEWSEEDIDYDDAEYVNGNQDSLNAENGSETYALSTQSSTDSEDVIPPLDEDEEEELDPEVSEFLDLVKKDDAASVAREKKRLRALESKTGKFHKRLSDGMLVIPPCRCCLVKVFPYQFGKSTKCPKCKIDFLVPKLQQKERSAKKDVADAVVDIKTNINPSSLAYVKAGAPYKIWIQFLHLHLYEIDKLKNTPGELEKSFIPVDLGFSLGHLVIVQYAPKPGNYQREDKKIEKLRAAVLETIKQTQKIESTKEYTVHKLPIGWLSQFQILYPVKAEFEAWEQSKREAEEISKAKPKKGKSKEKAPTVEILPEPVPLFGHGRIGIRLPPLEEGHKDKNLTLSFTLSEYRSLVSCCIDAFGYDEFSESCLLPQEVQSEQTACKLSNKSFPLLNHIGFYEHDSHLKIEKVGNRCESCHEFISDEGQEAKKKEIQETIAEQKSKKNKNASPMAAGIPAKLPGKGQCCHCLKNLGDHPEYILALKKETKK